MQKKGQEFSDELVIKNLHVQGNPKHNTNKGET